MRRRSRPPVAGLADSRPPGAKQPRPARTAACSTYAEPHRCVREGLEHRNRHLPCARQHSIGALHARSPVTVPGHRAGCPRSRHQLVRWGGKVNRALLRIPGTPSSGIVHESPRTYKLLRQMIHLSVRTVLPGDRGSSSLFGAPADSAATAVAPGDGACRFERQNQQFIHSGARRPLGSPPLASGRRAADR
jgi:hypothetical protein